MTRTRQVLLLALVAGCSMLAGCASLPPSSGALPTLAADPGSFRMSLAVDKRGTVHLADAPPLSGRIDIAPILAAEGLRVGAVQVILHQGRLYLAADGFRNLWEVAPQADPARSTYRPIAIAGRPLGGVRLSRYGPPGRVCVRLDADTGGPWFLGRKGKIDAQCS